MNDWVLIQSLVVAVSSGTPVVLAGTGAILTQRSGVLDLGVEGTMLIGAVTGFWVTTSTNSPFAGLVAAVLAAAAFSMIQGVLAISLRANQVVVGVALVILGSGLSSFIGDQGEPAVISRISGGIFEPVFPESMHQWPAVGPLLLSHDPVVYLSWAFVSAVNWYIFRTRTGMHLRAVGHDPASADAAGIYVSRMRYLHVALGGAAAGAGGGYLTLRLFSDWFDDMTAGMGWIAVILVILAGWRSLRLLVAAYAFGAISSLGFTLQLLGWKIPTELLAILPFLVVYLVMVFVSAAERRSQMPASLAEPYFRESR